MGGLHYTDDGIFGDKPKVGSLKTHLPIKTVWLRSKQFCVFRLPLERRRLADILPIYKPC